MDTINIGDKIVAARKKLNLSQAQLALQMFISAQAVGKWERGESIPDIVTVSRLAEILGVDLNYFGESSQVHSEESISHPEERPIENPLGLVNPNGPATRAEHHVNFSGSNLIESDFAGIVAQKRVFNGSALRGSDFSGADLSGSSFSGSDMRDCNFDRSNLTDCVFSAVDLSNASFATAILVRTEISTAGLDGVRFSQTDFIVVKLTKADLRKTAFESCSFSGVDFNSSDLSGVVLDGQTFDGVKFHNTGLKGTSFKGATLKNASFRAPLLVTNRYYRAIQMINFDGARMDKLSYAALKGLGANLATVELI